MNVGDWIFHEFRLKQVIDISPRSPEEDIVTVSCGSLRVGGRGLGEDCRPLTLRNKRISDEWMWHYRELKNFRALDFGEISRYLIKTWLKTIDGPDEEISSRFKELSLFTEEVKSKFQDGGSTVQGVRIFQRTE